MPDPPVVPRADRPFMPGYGIAPAGEGAGLLPWSWAEERLAQAHDFWIATVRPDGHPHVMPVWGVWREGALWFSTSPQSRKARNLRAHPRCSATTDDARHPVVIEGDAHLVDDVGAVEGFCAASNARYGTDYDVSFYLENATFRVAPRWAFALDDEDFIGTPTRWRFDQHDA